MSKSRINVALLLAIISIFMLIRCQQEKAGSSGSMQDGVFIHISNGTNDPHRVLMALNMAVTMADDRNVLVYFDVRGVEVVVQNAIDLQFGEFPSSKRQLKKLLEKEVPLLVCSDCLKAAGRTEADVIEGVQIADKEVLFDFTQGRILTLNY